MAHRARLPFLIIVESHSFIILNEITSDRFDRQILEIPSGNSGLRYAEIGRMISLSPSVTKERVRNLTDVGNQKDSV